MEHYREDGFELGDHYRIITEKNGRGALRRGQAVLHCNDPVLIL